MSITVVQGEVYVLLGWLWWWIVEIFFMDNWAEAIRRKAWWGNSRQEFHSKYIFLFELRILCICFGLCVCIIIGSLLHHYLYNCCHHIVRSHFHLWRKKCHCLFCLLRIYIPCLVMGIYVKLCSFMATEDHIQNNEWSITLFLYGIIHCHQGL